MIRPLEITSLSKSFDTPTGPNTVVKDFNAKIAPGEFVSLLGHSGCGKSTVLSIIAGLQRATLGGVVIDGREVTEPGLERAFVFQSPCLLPWATAGENVLMAARQAHPKFTSVQQKEVARKYMDMMGVDEYWASLPADLSQGTQQRVSIARALSLEPRFLLLDEPFGMLDSITRCELQDKLVSVWEKDRKTVILVTHDVDEALYLSDRIILMTDGPEARVGLEIAVPFPRPRNRSALVERADYFQVRARILGFLEDHTRQFKAA